MQQLRMTGAIQSKIRWSRAKIMNKFKYLGSTVYKWKNGTRDKLQVEREGKDDG